MHGVQLVDPIDANVPAGHETHTVPLLNVPAGHAHVPLDMMDPINER